MLTVHACTCMYMVSLHVTRSPGLSPVLFVSDNGHMRHVGTPLHSWRYGISFSKAEVVHNRLNSDQPINTCHCWYLEAVW